MSGSNGSGENVREYRVTNTCGTCAHTVSYNIKVTPVTDIAPAQEFYCPKCPAMPLMLRGFPVRVEPSRVQLAPPSALNKLRRPGG